MSADTGKPDEPGQMAYWMDHRGDLIGPAPADNPTGWEKHAGLTHRIMRPQPGQLVQAISWCGHRVHEVPGHGPVDCPECLELIAEEAGRAANGPASHASLAADLPPVTP